MRCIGMAESPNGLATDAALGGGAAGVGVLLSAFLGAMLKERRPILTEYMAVTAIPIARLDHNSVIWWIRTIQTYGIHQHRQTTIASPDVIVAHRIMLDFDVHL